MRLLIESEDHYSYLNKCLDDKPTNVSIATYGLYAGIMPDGRDTREWGDRYRSEAREFLERLREVPKVQMLIGLYEYKSCKGKKTACLDCESKYVMDLVRLLNHAEKFPEFRWRISSASHVKCSLFVYGDGSVAGVAGSRNLSDSNWAEVTVELDKMSTLRLQGHFVEIWKQSSLLNSDRINKVMEDQGVSEQAAQKILQTP